MKYLDINLDWLGAVEPGPEFLKALEVRTMHEHEMERVRELLNEEHYLGAAKDVGRTLVQIVHHRERWVALLVWAGPAMKLIDRDEWIGWTHQQRSERLGLIVQNRRFLVIAETRMPNLASRALALAVGALPAEWEERWGYRPVLAETFTDIEAFEGSCYKAAGWEACGMTKGFERHRADFYREHKRPKKLWLKTLSRNTRVILCATDVPKAYLEGVDMQSAERVLPLKAGEIMSLREALMEVPDPRKSNRVWRLSSLLVLICMGLLAGRKNLAEIHRYGQFLTQQQRGWLGFRRKRESELLSSPSYAALYNLLRKLDPDILAQSLENWLSSYHGELPRALALDGKYIRNLILTLALSEHESGAPVALTIASREPKSEEAKTEGEITAAKRLYQNTNIRGAVITADALHCERESMELIVEKGADFLLQLKNNQPKAFERAQGIAASDPPLFAPARR